jgi:serine/threonine-protein phosphatase 4 regulatory subunit 1
MEATDQTPPVVIG